MSMVEHHCTGGGGGVSAETRWNGFFRTQDELRYTFSYLDFLDPTVVASRSDGLSLQGL